MKADFAILAVKIHNGKVLKLCDLVKSYFAIEKYSISKNISAILFQQKAWLLTVNFK